LNAALERPLLSIRPDLPRHRARAPLVEGLIDRLKRVIVVIVSRRTRRHLRADRVYRREPDGLDDDAVPPAP
jgi:hypothetical protein